MKVLGSRLEVGKEAAKTMRKCIYIYPCIKHYFKRRARTMRKKKKNTRYNNQCMHCQGGGAVANVRLWVQGEI